MDCRRCPEGEPRQKCDNPRHHCDTCQGIGMIRASYPDTFISCPDCQPKDIRI